MSVRRSNLRESARKNRWEVSIVAFRRLRLLTYFPLSFARYVSDVRRQKLRKNALCVGDLKRFLHVIRHARENRSN